MTISAFLAAAGLSDVGYRFYDNAGSAVGARVTVGVIDSGSGWYEADATIPGGAVSVRWDSTGTPAAAAREYLDTRLANLDAAITSRAPESTALSTANWSGARAAKLDNLDTNIGSRMATFTYTAPPTAADNAGAVWGAASRTLTAFAFGVTVTSNNDKTGYALSVAGVTAVQSGLMLAASYAAAPTAAANAAAVWGEASRTLSAFLFDVSVESADITAIRSGLMLAANYSAPPSELSISTQVNTTLSAAHGSGSWLTGSGGGGGSGLSGPVEVTITFVDEDATAVPFVEFAIEGVGAGRADAEGIASFGLSEGTYAIVMRATSGVMFEPAALVVTDVALEQTIEGAQQAITPPTSPNLCRVTGYVLTPSGVAADALVTFTLTPGSARHTSGAFYSAVREVETDADGFIDVELLRTDAMTPGGAVYRVEVSRKKSFATDTPQMTLIKSDLTLTTATKNFGSI